MTLIVYREELATGNVPLIYRKAELADSKIDAGSRTVTFKFSSEYEVERQGWVEILGHRESEIDFSAINNGAPYLFDHRWDDQRGVVEKAWLENGAGYCRVRISRNPAGEELWLDIQDGIRTHVSVGYRILEAVPTKQENGMEYWRIVRWQPQEVSSVSLGADPTVGLGRSAEQVYTQFTLKEARTMDEDENEVERNDGKGSGSNPTPTGQNKARSAESATDGFQDKPSERESKSDAQRIAEAASSYGAVDLGNEFIRSGGSYNSFHEALTKHVYEKRNDPAIESTSLDLDMPTSDLQRYSVIKALRGAATGNWKEAGLERQVSNNIAERMGSDPDGVYLSYEAMGFGLRQQLERQMLVRTQAVGSPGLGAELVATELHSELFIEFLRSQAVVGGLGARFMTGLVGNLDIPKQAGSATFYWVAEDGAPENSELLFTTVQLNPKTIATAVPITRRMMIQSTPDIEALVRSDIMNGIALGLDNALLKGSGIGEEPTGIINTTGIGSVDISEGVSWSSVVEMESDVAEANVKAGSSAYLMRPTMRGTLKTTEKAAGTAQFIWDSRNTVNGYRAEVTTEMAQNAMLFGDFSQAMVGMWGALDVVPDKSTKAASGGLVMRMFQDADVAIRHAQAFTYAE